MAKETRVTLRSDRRKIYFISIDLPDKYVLAEVENPYITIEKAKDDPDLEFIYIDSKDEFLSDLRMEQEEQG